MVKDINSLNDFTELISTVNLILELSKVNPQKDSINKVKELVTLVSEPILNISSEENAKVYSEITLSLLNSLDKNNSFQKINQWFQIARELIAIKFVVENTSKECSIILLSDDVEKTFVDFFGNSNNKNILNAYVFSVMRYAHKDPKFCYNELINSFKKYPKLYSELYRNISYVYSADLICDKISESCPICGGKEAIPFYCANQATCNDSKFSPAKLWMKCTSCNNLYAYNFPVSKNNVINGHYTKKDDAGILPVNRELSVYSEIFNRIKYFNQNSKYLEIGIGNGEMLAVALEMGYNVSAVEICKEDCENISNALGVDIVWADFANYHTDEKFDVIVMGDVIEHVIEPIKMIKKAYDLLEENGVLWLSTPNFNSSFTRMKKFTDPMWNQKNHFTYFSYETLKPFIEKIGFKIVRYDVSNRYNGSMELILQK